MRFRHFAGIVLGAWCFVAQAALAQSIGQSGIAGGAPKPPEPTTKPEAPPPAAVPGARARPGTVVPADRTTADLPPTEALFDAINRGDISSARDALSRGADLDATNALGLTPTELSVDLARNDITFLLLSLRGGSGGQRGPQVQPVTDAPPPIVADRHRVRQQSRAASSPHSGAMQTVARPPGPPLFAGNGGAADPSVGFLGFDPGH